MKFLTLALAALSANTLVAAYPLDVNTKVSPNVIDITAYIPQKIPIPEQVQQPSNLVGPRSEQLEKRKCHCNAGRFFIDFCGQAKIPEWFPWHPENEDECEVI